MRTIALFVGAALALATGPAAFAATKPAPATVAAAKTSAAAAKTSAAAVRTEKAATTAKVAAATAANPNKVTTKTSTGKTVTYDCSKAGNKTKTACKGKG